MVFLPNEPELFISGHDKVMMFIYLLGDALNFILFFLKILFIYLTERDIEREGTQAEEVGEGEAGLPPSREPDVGLDPRTLGS